MTKAFAMVLASFILFLSCALPCFSAERKAVLSCSPASAEIGDIVNIVLEVTLPEGESPDFSDDISVKDLEIIGKKQPLFSDKDGVSVSVYQFEAQVWDEGRKEIGPLAVKLPSGGVLMSNKTTLDVKSVLGEGDTDIRDIKKNADIAFPLWFYLACAAAVMAVIALIWFVVRMAAKKRSRLAEERILTPEEEAEEALKRLSSSELMEGAKIKEYYSELSGILKKYIEARYSLSAMDSTTAELYRLLRDSSGSTGLKEHAQALKQLLGQCDMVKFACFVPDTMKEDLDTAKDIYGKIKFDDSSEE